MSKRKRTPKLHPNQVRAQQEAQAGQAPSGLLTSPMDVASAVVHKTIGEDVEFGRCSTALQLLPNQTVLLLITDKDESGADRAHTFFAGEEVNGFSVTHSMIDTLDETADD